MGFPTGTVADLEVHVRYVLHLAGACRGEPIMVERSRGRIRVQGVLGSAPRKAEIAQALAALDASGVMVVDLSTADETEADAALPAPAAGAEATPMLARGGILAEEAMARYLQAQGSRDPNRIREEITAFANRAFGLSQTAVLEAGALKHLAETWRPEQWSGLQPASRWLLELMFRDHSLALGMNLEELQQLLEPVFPSGSSVPAPSAEQAGSEFFEQIRGIHQLVAALFAGDPNSGSGDATTAAAGLLGRLRATTQGLPELQSRITAGLLDTSARR